MMLIIKCPVCKLEFGYGYEPSEPKHIRKFTCDRCNVEFQRTIPGTAPKKKVTNNGYSRRRYERRFEVKQMDRKFGDVLSISEYRTYKKMGDTEWYGCIFVHPDYLGSFIDDLENGRLTTKADINKVLTVTSDKGMVIISDDSMSYYRVCKIKADSQKLIQELGKLHQKWLMRDRQLSFLRE